MAALTAIVNRPAIPPLSFFAKPSSCKLVSCTRLRAVNTRCRKLNAPDKLTFLSETIIKYKKRRIRNHITTYVSRDSSVEEGIGAHGQEAFDAELARFEMNQLEAFLNDLVGIFTSYFLQ